METTRVHLDCRRLRSFVVFFAAFAQPSSKFIASAASIRPHRWRTRAPWERSDRCLGQRGYVLGHDLRYDARGSFGDNAKLSQLMDALKDERVDVVLGDRLSGGGSGQGLKIPTVMVWGVGDPVATGLIDGLARPGGNVTGISDVATTLTTKRLELLKKVSPTLLRVAMLWNKDDLGMTLRYQALRRLRNRWELPCSRSAYGSRMILTRHSRGNGCGASRTLPDGSRRTHRA